MTAIIISMLPYLIPVITGLLTWLTASIAKKNADLSKESKTQAALIKLGVIGVALLQKGWDHIGPEVQTALADGTISTEERATIEASVKELLADATDTGTLEEVGKALGLPLAGVIAWIASFLIGKWTEAHDPAVPASSANTYPTPAMVESAPMVVNQGAEPPLPTI
jgi:hypothetical protein